MIKRGFADAQLFGDIIQRGGTVAFLVKKRSRCVDNLLFSKAFIQIFELMLASHLPLQGTLFLFEKKCKATAFCLKKGLT
jgi:hypothetical protein